MHTTSWGSYEKSIHSGLQALDPSNFLKRLAEKDAALWKDDPAHQQEIHNRLGWLTAPEQMAEHIQGLELFAAQLSPEGFQYAVLLGMGGSSLAPEVFQNIFGNRAGFPTLIVLDSTDPRRIRDVEQKIRKEKTLFIVASKSGTTLESASLYKYFFKKVESSLGAEAGSHFIAITDPGTVLVELAQQKKFRRIFLNPSDVGGRFSALTLFGLVPAAVIGVPVEKLLMRAQEMAKAVADPSSAESQSVLALGVSMAHLALQGRNKLTLLTSSRWEAFGDLHGSDVSLRWLRRIDVNIVRPHDVD